MSEQLALSLFTLPENLAAGEPPEVRGISRSDVRLMVIDRKSGRFQHSRFEKIADFLSPGDLLVFNSSRTLPASLIGRETKTGSRLEVRLAEHLPDDSYLALLLFDGKPFTPRGSRGIEFGQGLDCSVYSRDERIPHLWKIRFSVSGSRLLSLIYRLGRPIRYDHVPHPWSLEHYQNVYAKEPGSSEMPSAGRAFTWKILFELKRRGIDSVNVVLHAGLSSYMDDGLDSAHPVSEEEFSLDYATARKINNAHRRRSRVIAVGTTVVRTLESAADEKGTVYRSKGYTRLHITSEHRLRSVDGLLTGFHEPQASHLELLQAFLPKDQIRRAYEEAIRSGYLWHEFGDLNLII